MIITAYDGKEFKGSNPHHLVDECNAYEANLRLQKEKDEAERKAKEENDKQLKQLRVKKLDEINNILHKANDMVIDYEKATGRKVIYAYDYASKSYMVTDTKTL